MLEFFVFCLAVILLLLMLNLVDSRIGDDPWYEYRDRNW